MTANLPRPSVAALRTALARARMDPRVEAISRSLRLDLADESLWQRVRGQAELNHQLFVVGASGERGSSSQEQCTGGWHRRDTMGAIAAYEAMAKL
jgi:hypothetical protein